MKIEDFNTNLRYSKLCKEQNKKRKGKSELIYINKDVKNAIRYIRKLYKDLSEEERSQLSKSEIKELIINDYEKIKEETETNSLIYNFMMLLSSIKYLENHTEEISSLKEEAKERGITGFDGIMTDNFHDNLIKAVKYLEEGYEYFTMTYHEKFKTSFKEIERDMRKYGEEIAFTKFCDRCLKYQGICTNSKRILMNDAYAFIFGLEGEKSLSPNKKVEQYKKVYRIKGYIERTIENVEATSKRYLANAISIMCERLDNFNYFSEAQRLHKIKMEDMGLPGLIYNVNGQDTSNNPNICRMLSYKELEQGLDIQELIRMNSFYSNKLAKYVKSYGLGVFYLESKGLLEDVVQEKGQTSEYILPKKDKDLESIYEKYNLVTSMLKQYFKEKREYFTQNQAEFDEIIKENKYGEGIYNEREISVFPMPLDIEPLVEEIKGKWGKEYKEYFEKTLPDENHNIEEDFRFLSRLYLPVFNSYQYKSLAIKSEIANILEENKENPQKYRNYGIILEYDKTGRRIPIYDMYNVLFASDGRTGINRQHILNSVFTEFVKAYNGTTLVRVYEGNEDLELKSGRTTKNITTQLLLPFTNFQTDYLTKVQRGNWKTERKTLNRVTEYNRAYFEHMLFCAGITKSLRLYTRKITKLNKKGKFETKEYPRIRYLDLETNILYEQDIDGKLQQVVEERGAR